MDIQQVLQGLIDRLPKNVSADELSARTPPPLPPIKIFGALLGQSDDAVAVKVGETILKIKVNDIISLVENKSAPAVQNAGIYVSLEVISNARFLETRARNASEFGQSIGSRPLVYEIPSEAAQYSVPHSEYRKEQERFFERSGISRLLSGSQMLGVAPRSLTSYETPQGTIVDTITQTPTDTGTPNDTQTDYSVDHASDQQTDYVRDYRDDVI
jgi:hypothetical protein